MGFFKMDKSYLLFTALHFICLVFAVTVIGLYGQDLHEAMSNHKYSDSKWIYAVVVGSLSAVTCVVYFIPPVLVAASFAIAIWDLVLFILWIALFGVFGKMFINENPEGIKGIQRMKNAVWIDLVNALLWLFAAAATGMYWFKHHNNRTRFTGRAHV